jgi:hypothetical protein
MHKLKEKELLCSCLPILQSESVLVTCLSIILIIIDLSNQLLSIVYYLYLLI